MFVKLFLTLFFGLMGTMNFVLTVKLSKSHKWSAAKTSLFFSVDALLALAMAVVLIAVWLNN